MIAPPRPPSHDELAALIMEAQARRRRLLGATGVAIVAAIALAVYALTIGRTSDNVAQPANSGRTSAPLCRSSQLAGAARFQGATQTMLGGITIRNESAAACSLPSERPRARISWRGAWLPTREVAMPPPPGFSSVGVLAPGAQAVVLWQWWSCGRPGPHAAVRPGFRLSFGHGLVVVALSDEVTSAFCGSLGSTNLGVTRPLTQS